jgi:hypothetical protein
MTVPVLGGFIASTFDDLSADFHRPVYTSTSIYTKGWVGQKQKLESNDPPVLEIQSVARAVRRVVSNPIRETRPKPPKEAKMAYWTTRLFPGLFCQYATNGGWGFQVWAGGEPSKPLLPDIAHATQGCFVCHTPQKAQDYTFSTYIP